MNHFPIWDFPTRAFHWLLVTAFLVSWLASEFENADVHAWSGYVVLVLLLFRILWGFVGSIHSRFSDFLCGPKAIRAYLSKPGDHGPGHNPLGAWSVMAMLTLLCVQVGTGLFLTDEVLFDAPFRALVDSSTAETLSYIHELNFNFLTALVVLHIAAIGYYKVRGVNLVAAMLTGGRGGQAAPAKTWLAVVLVCVLSVLVYVAFQLAPEPSYDF